MAVTKADKVVELQALESAFQGSDTAILVDFKGLNVPQVTELRRQLRTARASYQVVKNTLAKRALKGTSFAPLEKHFQGTTAVAFTRTDPVLLAKTLTSFVKTAPALSIKAAVVQGRGARDRSVLVRLHPTSRNSCAAARTSFAPCCQAATLVVAALF